MMIGRSHLLKGSTALLVLIISVAALLPSAESFSPAHRAPEPRWSATSASASTSASAPAPPPAPTFNGYIQGPPVATKPDYSSIHGPLGPIVDGVLMSLFRAKLAERLDGPDNRLRTPDSELAPTDFMGIVDLTSRMNAQYNNRTEVQELAREVLVSLFPPFILDRYPSWFARPFPEFSARLCAWATVAGGTWLMGECEVNDVPGMDGGERQGVLVKRCRFLEESQCASICVNSCKIPTQNFFRRNMGLALTMTPDYETGECQFAYGKLPTEEEERQARNTPCLMRCPSSGGLRSWHNEGDARKEKWLEDLDSLALVRSNELKNDSAQSSNCMLMED
ncbi:hypothetical protein ACHAWF_015476 [Thalassiosira exigua]